MIYLYATIIIIIIYILLSFIAYMIVFFSPYKQQNDLYSFPNMAPYAEKKDQMISLINKLNDRPFQEITIKSYDGLLLYGKYYQGKDNQPFDICFHGYRGMGIRDFSGGGELALSLGHHVLIIDQRAQGKSKGHTMTFGYKEKRDCLSWINYLLERNGQNISIFLLGVSMGAGTVIQATSLPLPSNVKGVIADAPYTSAPDIIKSVCKSFNLPSFIFYPPVAIGAFLFGRFNVKKADCLKDLDKAQIPILIMHGEEDHFVPCNMSLVIKEKNPDMIKRYTFPHAGHGLSLLEDYDRYKEIVKEFIESTL